MNSSSLAQSTDWPAAIIPIHYHYHMLNDPVRMTTFKAAIEFLVKPGFKVLELGAGSAVMSFLASQQGAKVTCVEIEAPTAEAARNILRLNGADDKVEVVLASALDYLPPERVDVVICEMVHVAMVREQQVAVMDSFRRRYLEKFGPPLPIFLPCGAILAVQPVEQDFNFYGYVAPVPIFQQADLVQPRTNELGDPVVSHLLEYSQPMPERLTWAGTLPITKDGEINAIRFITKNVLSVDTSTTPPNFINWFSQYLVLPLPHPKKVKAGDTINLAFDYPHGAEISSLQNTLRILD